MKNILVVGLGEVGSSLVKVLEDNKNYKIFKKDKDDLETDEEIDIMHICIPWSDGFVDTVVDYVKKYKPKLTIINSTVRVGDTHKIFKKVGGLFVHSPVRGRHPDLKGGLINYVKFIGPCTKEAGELAKKHFESLGIKTEILNSPTETELGKLFSTTYYGLCIAYHQEMERICKKFGAEFEQAVTRFNQTHNKKIDENLKRPIMFPGVISGHCVIPNIHLLKGDVDSDFLDTILNSNKLKKSKPLRK